jgi:hypothetical protein
MLPFDTWTLEQAKKAAALGADIQPLIEAAIRFYNGDHWQNGDGWIGPRPQVGEIGEAEVLTMIENAFVSRNVIKEIVDRHARGVVGFEPAWRFIPRRPMEDNEDPTDAEQADIDDIEAALTEWWNARKIHGTIKSAVADLLQAQRSHFRMYVPRGLLVEGPAVPQSDGTTKPGPRGVSVKGQDGLAGALKFIYVDHPLPTNAAVYTDPDSQQSVGILIYRQNAGSVDKEEGPETAELTYLNEIGQTVIRTVSKDTATSASFTFDLGGHLTMIEMDREPLITKQLTQGQKALNLALSMMPRNVMSSGFLERVLLNAQMPGYWTDASGNRTTDINARKKFVPLPYKAGAGTTNFVRGMDYIDGKTGETKITDPTISFREPSPVAPTAEAKRSHYQDMLEEADQAHVLLQAEATPSGRSREQARADYLTSLSDTTAAVEAAGRWLLETALAMAELFGGRPNVLGALYRCDFTAKINAGPITDAERTANEASVDKRTLSRESAMERNGVMDVDAELSKINEDPTSQLTLLTAQLTAITAATGAGMGIVGAAKLVGLTPQQVGIIQTDLDEQPHPPENGDLPASDNPPTPKPKPALVQ